MKLIEKFKRNMTTLSITMIAAMLFASCDSWIYDDLAECKMYIQFRYDYNMLHTDAFAKQVEQVTVFFFDEDNHFIKSQTEQGEALSKDNYRMEVTLPSNKSYTALSWCGKLDSYELSNLVEGVSTPNDLQLRLKAYNATTNESNVEIDNLWHGNSIKFDRVVGSQTETIDLVRNTNRFRVILKDINASSTDVIPVSDFNINISSANASYDYNHNLLPSPTISYKPYFTSGDNFNGMVAELNTMRITTDEECLLTITDDKGRSIFGDSTPHWDLTNFLLLTKMESYKMSNQEFLDRQYDWNVIVYYSSANGAVVENPYLAVKIIINDWTVWNQEVDV